MQFWRHGVRRLRLQRCGGELILLMFVFLSGVAVGSVHVVAAVWRWQAGSGLDCWEASAATLRPQGRRYCGTSVGNQLDVDVAGGATDKAGLAGVPCLGGGLTVDTCYIYNGTNL